MKTVKLLMVALLLAVSGTANAQLNREQIKYCLEEFCKAYYNDAFSPKQYIEGSLVITTVEPDKIKGGYIVKGKHGYRGQYIPIYGRKTHVNVDYKSEVKETNYGIEIRFWKWYEPDVRDPQGHWEGPCEKTIIP